MRDFFKKFFFPPLTVNWETYDFSAAHQKLNLGCGNDYREGWQNWDISDTVHSDARINVEKDVFPADDNFFDVLYANGVIEQIRENEGLLHCMNECHRVLKKAGNAVFVVPDSRFSITFNDPHDVRHFVHATFRYFCVGTKAYERYGRFYGYLPWSTYTASTDKRGLMTVVLTK